MKSFHWCVKHLHVVSLRQPHSSADISLDGEERRFLSLHEKSVIEETIAVLKKTTQSNNDSHNYRLGETSELQPFWHNVQTNDKDLSCGFLSPKSNTNSKSF